MQKQRGSASNAIIFLMALVVVVVSFLVKAAHSWSPSAVVAFDLRHTERGDERMFVYPVNEALEPFTVEDAFLRAHWSSGSVYAKLVGKKGCTATVRTHGFRLPLFSLYENIIEVKNVVCPKPGAPKQPGVEDIPD